MKSLSDARLRKALNGIFHLDLGLCVLLDGLLELRRTDNQLYSVTMYCDNAESTAEFKALDEAVTYFLIWRRRLKIGTDLDVGK